MKETRLFVSILAFGLGLAAVILVIPKGGLAQPVGPGNGDAKVASISNSTVTTNDCYEPGTSQTLCFVVHNASADAEWLDQVRLTFPTSQGAWTVSCKSQDAADSSGSPVNFTCSTPSTHEVLFTDNNGGNGEITAGNSWGFCVDVTVPGGYDGPRIINWGLSGDDDGAAPHDIEGQTTIEQCRPLMLRPNSLTVEGCNGITQTHTFELWNNSGSSATFDLTYEVSPEGSVFVGPSEFDLSASEIVTFIVQLNPDIFLKAGGKVTATLRVSGGGASDMSTIVNTITDLAGWQGRASSPLSTMDNVVVWASHQDGGLWSIGGYGANGATQRYDPNTNTWTTHTVEISPTIEYPMDGCYGLDEDGHEVVVLFPDTIVTGTLHRYDITDDAWDALAIPAFYPPEGRWGQDIVSLLNVAGDNVCYLSGGADQEGGGRARDLWVYYPDGTPGEYIGKFFDTPDFKAWFNFHASWYVPWVGDGGAVCVGGGIDHKSNIISATQCYDLAAETFNGVNADLGPLPEPWWGMADGWQTHNGRHQIWIANGVAQDGTLLPASAYADETTGGFVYGPTLPVGLYRLEGDGWNGFFYAEQGAAGGFQHSVNNYLLAHCPECFDIYLPAVLRNHEN